jgi:hypothetical protein
MAEVFGTSTRLLARFSRESEPLSFGQLAELSIVTVASPTHSEKTVTSPPPRGRKPTRQTWAGVSCSGPVFCRDLRLSSLASRRKVRRGAHPETRSENDFREEFRFVPEQQRSALCGSRMNRNGADRFS